MNHTIKTRFFFISCALLAGLFTTYCSSFHKHITFINRTGGPLNLQILDQPLRRSDIPHLDFYRLDQYEEMQLVATARIVGWYQPGERVDNTVLTSEDDVIVFIKHDGVIKTLHGELREKTLYNKSSRPLVFKTKNYHKDNINCKDCMNSCSTSQHCSCLDICHDTTEDMEWALDPYEQRNIKVASGTTIGINEIDYDL